MGRILAVTLTALLFLCPAATARPSYTGYSGAPGSSGTCASSCHGGSGGSIAVVGFPTSYGPAQTYTVSVVHRGGSSISNFNASVRIGTGSQTAGTITAGFQTTTYTKTGEPNGIRFSSNNRDSGTFTWTAPESAVGDVKLYLAGMQSSSMGGPNTALTLTSSPLTGLAEGRVTALAGLDLHAYPSVGTGLVLLRAVSPAGTSALLRISDASGRTMLRRVVESGTAVIWRPVDSDGARLAPGSYYATLGLGTQRIVRKLTLR
ncbi:hypothetical protein FJY69_00540 [candidate division WOR-3 bacterium]|nr:hypothetical protein [candidate division WOR-3 bacterium]